MQSQWEMLINSQHLHHSQALQRDHPMWVVPQPGLHPWRGFLAQVPLPNFHPLKKLKTYTAKGLASPPHQIGSTLLARLARRPRLLQYLPMLRGSQTQNSLYHLHLPATAVVVLKKSHLPLCRVTETQNNLQELLQQVPPACSLEGNP